MAENKKKLTRLIDRVNLDKGEICFTIHIFITLGAKSLYEWQCNITDASIPEQPGLFPQNTKVCIA